MTNVTTFAHTEAVDRDAKIRKEIEDREAVLANMLAVNAALAARDDYALMKMGAAETAIELWKKVGGYSDLNLAQARAVIDGLREALNAAA